jgi:hypothetical protein
LAAWCNKRLFVGDAAGDGMNASSPKSDFKPEGFQNKKGLT